MIGKGTFGQVWKCKDHKQDNFVAIKIIKMRNHTVAHHEKKMLSLVKSQHVIKLIDNFYVSDQEHAFVFPLHGSDLF